MYELMGLPYMVESIEMSSFHNNLNRKQIQLVAQDMS